MTEALPPGSGIPPWIRYGVVSGAFAFAVTLAASLVILVVRPADLCRVGPVIVPLAGLVAFIAFLFFAAAAGFATGRATGLLGQASPGWWWAWSAAARCSRPSHLPQRCSSASSNSARSALPRVVSAAASTHSNWEPPHRPSFRGRRRPARRCPPRHPEGSASLRPAERYRFPFPGRRGQCSG